MSLKPYRQKRDFERTPEPAGGDSRGAGNRYVIQKHAASRLHYDFRLELDGVLKSWAVPKGPSLDPGVKSLAVHVEDHPLEYGDFEGVIPKGQYGGGTVLLWDRGSWECEGDARKSYARGKLHFRLDGEKLRGRWILVRMSGKAGEGGKNWLLRKVDDDEARDADDPSVLDEKPQSVASGRSLEEIAAERDRVWSSKAGGEEEPGPSAPTAKKGRRGAKEEKPLDPGSLPDARRGRIPRSFQPQLATLVRKVPEGEDWLHEIKYDGYRLLAVAQGDEVRLLTRRGKDWTERFPSIASAVRKLGLEDTLLDGEVVILSPHGTTDFQALQNQMRRGRDDDVVYFVFDLPYHGGWDLTRVPLVDRKRVLEGLLPKDNGAGALRYSDHIVGQGPAVVEQACNARLEGVISKRADSPYVKRRSKSWLKVKCLERQEFVVGGWTAPSGSREGFGALLLGHYDDEKLIYCGRVGTGFTQQSLHDLHAELVEIEVEEPRYADPPRGSAARGVRWCEPRLVVEVEFTSWTDDGLLRHPSFRGLRDDKKAEDVMREEAATVAKRPRAAKAKRTEKASAKRARPTTKTRAAKARPAARAKATRSPARSSRSKVRSNAGGAVAGVRISHPDRVLYPDQGITKRELAEFYERIAAWILPHVRERPLSLVRCPRGRAQKCFYQKHITEGFPDSVRGVEIEEKDGKAIHVRIDDLEGLISLVQLGVLEIHPWGSRADRPDRPDRLIFDLDPGPGVGWKDVLAAAREVRDRLDALGLESYVRTSGGKGLHVVAPLVRRSSWEDVKSFARAIATSLEREHRDRYIATASKARREGKIFVDYLRNDRGATAIASYSTRARPGAPVATPVAWSELGARLHADTWNVRNLPDRLASLEQDPWEGFFDVQQSLTKKMMSEAGAKK